MIVGFSVNGIEAEKGGNVGGNLQINYSPEITDVTSTEVTAFDDEVAKIDFTFRVEYTSGDSVPAFIQLEGHVLWNGDTEEIVETWEEEKMLPESMQAPLMNDLYRKLLSEATGIADTLSMLPPIPTPQVQQNQ